MAGKTSTKAPRGDRGGAGEPVLLSGGNPQVAKGYGEAPVQAYVAAVPGWKREVVRRLDALVTQTVPGVRKAIKWNSPFYGAPDGAENTWFMSLHCFTSYVKVALFRGAALAPVPPGESKQANVRYLDVREHDPLDEARITSWIGQASRLPGEKM